MVNWGNLFIILKLLSFPPGWIRLTEMIVTTGKSALLVNGKAKPWFKLPAVISSFYISFPKRVTKEIDKLRRTFLRTGKILENNHSFWPMGCGYQTKIDKRFGNCRHWNTKQKLIMLLVVEDSKHKWECRDSSMERISYQNYFANVHWEEAKANTR